MDCACAASRHRCADAIGERFLRCQGKRKAHCRDDFLPDCLRRRFGQVAVGTGAGADAPYCQGKSKDARPFQNANSELPENGTGTSFVRHSCRDFFGGRLFVVRSAGVGGDGTFVDGVAVVALDETFAGGRYARSAAIEN